MRILRAGKTGISVNEIAELFDIIDPVAITEVREALTRTLAAELADEFLAIYNANHLDEYRVEHADIGKRTLRNACLRPAKNVLETVRGLLKHRSFSMSNPNRIRSLIGAFAGSNPAAFHAEDGSGYQFLVDMLTELNSRNPQVASRLIEPLIRLKRYDAKRQAKMRAALEQLKVLENLSGDLFEKIDKALA